MCRERCPRRAATSLLQQETSNGRWRQTAPLQLDDRATRPLEAAPDELDGPWRSGDAVEVVASERLALVRVCECRRRRANDRHLASGVRSAPGQHVVMVVAMDDEIGAMLRQDLLQGSSVLQIAIPPGLARQRRMVDQHEA